MISYIPAIIYVISMALGMVLLDYVVDTSDPILSLFITSLFAIIFFHAATKTKLKTIYQTCWQYRRSWFFLNVIVGIMWLGTYYSVKWLNPTACLFLFFLSMTTTHWARQLFKARTLNRNIINVILPILFIGVFYYFDHQDNIAKSGIAAGVIAGIMGSYYATRSKVFAANGRLTSNDVLAVRFYLIILLAPFFITPTAVANLTFLAVAKLILVSIFTFILPLFVYQRSVMILPLDRHIMAVAAIPLVAYLIQGIASHKWSLLLLCMSALTLFFLIGAEYLSNKRL